MFWKLQMEKNQGSEQTQKAVPEYVQQKMVNFIQAITNLQESTQTISRQLLDPKKSNIAAVIRYICNCTKISP